MRSHAQSPALQRALSALGIVAGVLVAAGCSRDESAVSVPLDPVPVPTVEDKTTTTVQTTALGDAGETSTSSAGQPGKRPWGGRRRESLASCCSALRALADAESKTPQERNLYLQAARICERNNKAVQDGKKTRAEALAEVRSSLLGPAPAACQ